MKSIFLHSYSCITPLGFDVSSNWDALLRLQSGIAPHHILANANPLYASVIDNQKLEKEFNHKFSEHTSFTRLEKMMLLALKPIIDTHPISEKSVLLLSTTKGNITSIKNQQQLPHQAHLHALATTIGKYFNFQQMPIVISNACVSGVMSIAIAKNLLQMGMYDDVYIVAGDEVSEFVVSGFNSFQAVTEEPCKPYDKNRSGINIGEATAAIYVSAKPSAETFQFEIIGESSINDANHISGPSRTGEGLFRSVQNAMREAKVSPEEIDFISAHGTATLYNDEMESIAFTRADLQNVPLHSLKGFYGHTLGTSGLLETIISIESSRKNTLIPTKNYQELGVSHPINIITTVEEKPIRYFLKTASGFGGCNSAIIIKKIES